MKRMTVLPLLSILLVFSCATQSGSISDNGVSPEGGIPNIAVILPIQQQSDLMADDIMIGITRLAREFDGTIHGREGDVSFGENVIFTILPTVGKSNDQSEKAITDKLRSYRLGKYDLVIGAGYHYINPFAEICDSFPKTKFIGVDFLFNIERKNLLSLNWNMAQPSFIAGAVAAERFSGQTIGVIGGMDFPFMWDGFLNPFIEGVEYMDDMLGANTSVVVEIAGTFSEPQVGYDIAERLFREGAQCIYHAAGATGDGVLDAAGDAGKWAIGVDRDQGLERALRGESSDHILTSVLKGWGEGAYLACREYLITGDVPNGTQIVGIAEGCAGLAINPYNTPILGDQLATIEKLTSAMIEGDLPTSLRTKEENVWSSIESPVGASIITVNAPVLSPGIPDHYGAMLQEALATEFHDSGAYSVINRDQVQRLLSEVKFSLEGLSDANTQLEVGRLIAAEAIVFINLGEIDKKLNIDCKMVNVETGLTVAATRKTYPDFENALNNLNVVVADLSHK